MKRSRESGAAPMQQQIERWERTPWTQRVECPESGCTLARPLSDEVPAFDATGVHLGEELNFHDDR